jgi:hypothetical protein
MVHANFIPIGSDSKLAGANPHDDPAQDCSATLKCVTRNSRQRSRLSPHLNEKLGEIEANQKTRTHSR